MGGIVVRATAGRKMAGESIPADGGILPFRSAWDIWKEFYLRHFFNSNSMGQLQIICNWVSVPLLQVAEKCREAFLRG